MYNNPTIKLFENGSLVTFMEDRVRFRLHGLWMLRNLIRKKKIYENSTSQIIKGNLRLKAHKWRTGHLLTGHLKQQRSYKSKRLLAEYADGKLREILFTDEKVLIVEEAFNKHNYRVYARSPKEASQLILKVQNQHPANLLVWWRVATIITNISVKRSKNFGCSVSISFA